MSMSSLIYKFSMSLAAHATKARDTDSIVFPPKELVQAPKFVFGSGTNPLEINELLYDVAYTVPGGGTGIDLNLRSFNNWAEEATGFTCVKHIFVFNPHATEILRIINTPSVPWTGGPFPPTGTTPTNIAPSGHCDFSNPTVAGYPVDSTFHSLRLFTDALPIDAVIVFAGIHV